MARPRNAVEESKRPPLTLIEKKEQAEEALRNVDGQLEQLAIAKQQLIGRVQTYQELVEEEDAATSAVEPVK